jgi:hypothetical protein
VGEWSGVGECLDRPFHLRLSTHWFNQPRRWRNLYHRIRRMSFSNSFYFIPLSHLLITFKSTSRMAEVLLLNFTGPVLVRPLPLSLKVNCTPHKTSFIFVILQNNQKNKLFKSEIVQIIIGGLLKLNLLKEPCAHGYLPLQTGHNACYIILCLSCTFYGPIFCVVLE